MLSMGTGWRRAFCNTNTNRGSGEETTEEKQKQHSNPSTPRLRCKTGAEFVNPKCERKIPIIGVCSKSNPSSPRSPFSILKSTLRISRVSHKFYSIVYHVLYRSRIIMYIF